MSCKQGSENVSAYTHFLGSAYHSKEVSLDNDTSECHSKEVDVYTHFKGSECSSMEVNIYTDLQRSECHLKDVRVCEREREKERKSECVCEREIESVSCRGWTSCTRVSPHTERERENKGARECARARAS